MTVQNIIDDRTFTAPYVVGGEDYLITDIYRFDEGSEEELEESITYIFENCENIKLITLPAFLVLFDSLSNKIIYTEDDLIYSKKAHTLFLHSLVSVAKTKRYDEIEEFIDEVNSNSGNFLYFFYNIQKVAITSEALETNPNYLIRYSKLEKPQIKRYKL